jgi:hypothetical protein
MKAVEGAVASSGHGSGLIGREQAGEAAGGPRAVKEFFSAGFADAKTNDESNESRSANNERFREIGANANADYVLVTKMAAVSSNAASVYLEVRLIDVRTGKTVKNKKTIDFKRPLGYRNLLIAGEVAAVESIIKQLLGE